MKRLLLFFACSLIISLNAHSQCTPDLSNTIPGIQPDSATTLPHAMVGVPYSTVMQVRVPLDTMFGSTTCDFDYIKITSFTGLPPGYTYSCNPSNCSFPGNSNGCVLISGPAPPQAWAGNVYTLTVDLAVTAHIHGFPNLWCAQDAPYTVGYYQIVIDPNTGIETLPLLNFDVWQNKPNPVSHNTTIQFSSPNNDTYTYKISNILGNIVYSKNITAVSGVNKITLSGKDFPSGVFFYTLGNNKKAITRRMVIQNE
jgi:hypothetical protein